MAKTRKAKRASGAGPPALLQLISRLESANEHELAGILAAIQVWDWPRTDLQCWVDVLNRFDAILETVCTDYDLQSIQTNPFTPRTQLLLLQIVRFTQLLLENATNRKIFNSYDRLNDLLLTRDVNVLEAVLRLALRPAQQYRRTDAVAEDRILQIAQGWMFREHGLTMAAVASETARPPPDASTAHFKFYREGPGLQSGEGMVAITLPRLDREELAGKSDVDIMIDAAEANRVPTAVRLGLLQRIRTARTIQHVEQRRQMLRIHCLAIAILSSLATDQRLQTKLLIYEPDLIPRLADLIQSDRQIPTGLQEVALHALEGLSRTRTKSNEVLNAVGISVNHGILMQTLRATVNDIVDSEKHVRGRDFVEALFGFISSLQNHHQHVGAALVGAGIIPCLVELVKRAPMAELSSATRAVIFLESASYAFTSAATALFGAEGIPTYIARLTELVELDANLLAAQDQSEAAMQIETSKAAENAFTRSSPSEQGGTLPQNHAAFLKAILRSLARMMSTNSNADALRNLIDGTLPQSIKVIIDNRGIFGPQIYALALNIMMTFVHNEPTSLSVLQEKGLPDAFYASIEPGLDASIDVISAVPNAIGALCLNETGLANFATKSKPIFDQLLSVLLLAPHLQVLLERENAAMFGATIDEIMRHHPSLKGDVFDTLATIMQRALTTIEGETATLAAGRLLDVSSDVIAPPTAVKSGLQIPARVEVLAKFLEGICQNQAHSRDVAKSNILDTLTAMVLAPAVAVEFVENASFSKAVISLYRIISDSANVACLTTLIRRTLAVTSTLKDLSKDGLDTQKFETLAAPTGQAAEQRANAHLNSLQQARAMLLVFEGIIPHVTYTQSRGVISSALSCLSGNAGAAVGGSSLLEELATLARIGAWEVARFQQTGNPSLPSAQTPNALLDEPLVQMAKEAASRGNTPALEEKKTDPKALLREHNLGKLRPVYRALSNSFRAIFTALVARPPPRRNPDANYRTEARNFSCVAARILLADLEWPTDFSNDDLAYAVIALNNVRELITQERWATAVETTLPVVFEQHSGIERVLALYERFATLSSESLVASEGQRAEHIMSTLQGEENATQRLRLLQAVSGMRVALELLNKLVSRRIIPESAVQGSGRAGDKPISMQSPSSYLITARAKILPAIAQTWKSFYLESLPPANVRLVYRTLLFIIEGDGEKDSDWSQAPSSSSQTRQIFSGTGLQGLTGLRPPFQLNEDRVRSVMDMGFSRGAAAHALRRTHNNANAAAEFLLQHPEVVALHIGTVETARSGSPDVREATNVSSEASASAAVPSAQSTTDAQMHDAAGGNDDLAQDVLSDANNTAAFENAKSLLAERRGVLKADFLSRAVTLLGTFGQLIFEIRDACRSSAFKDHSPGLEIALQALQQHSANDVLSASLESRLNAELRLLALIVTDAHFAKDLEGRIERAMPILQSFATAADESPRDGSQLPHWLGSLLLAMLSLFSTTEAPRKWEDDGKDLETDQDFERVTRGPSFELARSTAFNLTIKVVRAPTPDADTISASLRMLAFLARQSEFAHRLILCGSLPHILHHAASNEAKGVQETAIMIFRHIAEADDLSSLLRGEILDALKSQRRDLPNDIMSACTNLKHVASRDLSGMLRLLPSMVRIANDNFDSQNLSMVHLAFREDLAENNHLNASTAVSSDAANVTAFLMNELYACLVEVAHDMSSSVKTVTPPLNEQSAERGSGPEEPKRSDSETQSTDTVSQKSARSSKQLLRARLIMSCLTELFHSYPLCKQAFAKYKGAASQPADSAAYLDFLLEKVVTLETNNVSVASSIVSDAKAMRIGDWTALLIVSLASDSTPAIDRAPLGAGTLCQLQVTDALIRSLKRISATNEGNAQRYESCGILADLITRLLSATSADQRRNPRTRDDVQMLMAKTMVDKGMPAVLISVLSDIDLNFPSIELMIDRILKPLHLLSKLVSRIGPLRESNASASTTATAVTHTRGVSRASNSTLSEDGDHPASADSAEEDDPYRTSALGMYEGELEPGGMEADGFDQDEEYDEDEHEMDMLDDLAGPAPIIPSDESEDEGDVTQGFSLRDHDAMDEDMEEDMDEGDISEDDDSEHEGGVLPRPEGDYPSDDDLVELNRHSSALNTPGPPHSAWHDMSDDELIMVDDGADDMANELAEQLDEMRAGGGPADETEEPIDDEADLHGIHSHEGTESGSDDPQHDFEADEELDMQEMEMAGIESSNPGLRLLRGGLVTGDLDEDPTLAASRSVQNVQDGLEPRFLGALNGGSREGLREVGTHSLLVDPESSAQPSRGRSAAGHGPSHLPNRRGLNELLGQGTFALLEQFMQDFQGPNGSGLSGLFGPVEGRPLPNLIIETGGLHIRGAAARMRTPGPFQQIDQHHPHHHHHHRRRPGEETAGFSTSTSAVPTALTPASTALRWDQEARLYQSPSQLHERLRVIAELVLAVLRPAARAARKKREEAEAATKAEEDARVREKQTTDPSVPKETDNISATPADAPVDTNADNAMPAGDTAQPVLPLATDAQQEHSSGQIASSDDAQAAAVIAIARALGSTGDQAEASATTPEGAPVDDHEVVSRDAANARVTILIRGGIVDITDTGIDPTFLEALPDDMREEIVNQHRRETRPAVVNPTVPTSISAEFLDALPPGIRAEVLQQERLEQMRQRSRSTQPVIGSTEMAPAAHAEPEEMDAASFLATLDDPLLRESVLLEHVTQGGPAFIASLPADLAAEVAAMRQRFAPDSLDGMRARARRPFRLNDGSAGDREQGEAPSKTATREAVQLIDKSGVANLIRLLFMPQTVQQMALHAILQNLCLHSKTRIEVIGLLLGILQDGTSDVRAVERTYFEVTKSASKASATPKLSAKRGKTLGDALGESTPNLIAQRCLDALTHLVSANAQAPSFFLQEQDPSSLMHRRLHSANKGKGKEKEKVGIFPLTILLELLERQSVLSTQSLMESLTSLLAAVTRPLSESSTVGASISADRDSSLDAGNVDAMQLETPSGQGNALAPSVAEPVTVVAVKPPPTISPDTLRSLINILDGECSSRTFQHTLNTLQHVATLPGAKDTLSDELISRAERYSRSIESDLSLLSNALSAAQKQADISSDTLARFAPASSGQAKLLRVLKTLDYLYLKASKGSEGNDSAKVGAHENEAALSEIYLGLSFAGIWRLTGECLDFIDARPELIHMATVLLPLIEALLVLAKSLGSSFSRAGREAFSPVIERGATSPREYLESTFLAFTRRYRKVLNVLVRNNPTLVSGTFSVLVKAPGVLDFEAKRNYFNAQLHKRSDRRQYGTIPLNLRRAYLFEDTFQALHRRSAAEIKHGRISIRFYNEEGVDAGGLTRDWATQLVKRIFNPDYALFSPSSSDALVWQPNPQSYVNPDHLAFFAFVGRVIAKFVYDGRLLDAFFCRSFYKHLLGIPVTVADLESVDPDSFRSLTWMLENDIDGVLDLTFSTETDAFGVETTVDLKSGGRDIAVTNANKREYVELVATHRLTLSISEQINAFVTGFTEIIPRELVSVFSPQELQLLISGLPDIDADEWRAATDYAGGLTATSPTVSWFWRAVRSFNQEERAKLLQFATGSSRVPLEGFGALQGSSGITRFTVVGAHTTDALPSAHTCFNQLDLPNYPSYEALREKLLIAISETEGFGFA